MFRLAPPEGSTLRRPQVIAHSESEKEGEAVFDARSPAVSGSGLTSRSGAMPCAAAVHPLIHAQETKHVCPFSRNKAVRRLACSCLDFEHCWPEQFSESRILQPTQPTSM